MPARTDEGTFERIAAGFEDMTQQDIVIAPWLATDDGEERLSAKLKRQLKKHARSLSSWKDPEVFWIDIDLTPEFLERAFYEVLLSTAAYLSYLRLGTLIITEEMVSVSNSLLRNYLGNNGSTALLSVYARVITYLNNQLLLYYGQVTEETFISGKWHRPWIDYSLEDELDLAIRHGFMERVQNNEETFIQLTEAGEKLYKECRDDLDKCGYIQQHEQLMRASNFTNMDDYEKILKNATPRIHEHRKSLIKWSEIQSGMTVLELGCGTGALTLDDGLFKSVGHDGTIVATDPSFGMLERAKLKLSDYGASNVQFKQASAESIPYRDNSFDAVIGMLFLHFTDIPRALQEIHRVLRSGGTFTTLYGLDFAEREPFFKEWFDPVFEMGLISNKASSLPDKEFVCSAAGTYFHKINCIFENWTLDFSNIEDVVRFVVKTGMMTQLNDLPWEAREVLFQELVDRGYAVRKKYGESSLKRFQSVEWFKGTVMK